MSAETTPQGVCTWCDGTGYRSCPACNGWGKTGGHDEYTCGNCGGTGNVPCEYCNPG